MPILLWTSIVFSTAMVWIFGGALVARVFGLVLRDNPLYIIPTDLLGLFAIYLAVFVEWFVVEDPKR